MVILETERLLLRFIEAADLGALSAICADAEAMRFVGGPLDRNGTWESIRRIQALYRERRLGPFAVVRKSSGELIGRCGFLFWKIEGRDEVEVAYLLARTHWGHGLATEAVRALVRLGLDRLRLPRLIALIHPENAASIRVAEKATFAFEKEIELPIHGVRRLYFTCR